MLVKHNGHFSLFFFFWSLWEHQMWNKHSLFLKNHQSFTFHWHSLKSSHSEQLRPPVWKGTKVSCLHEPASFSRTLRPWYTLLSSLVSHCFLCLLFPVYLAVVRFTKVWFCEIACASLHLIAGILRRQKCCLSTCMSRTAALLRKERNPRPKRARPRWKFVDWTDKNASNKGEVFHVSMQHPGKFGIKEVVTKPFLLFLY